MPWISERVLLSCKAEPPRYTSAPRGCAPNGPTMADSGLQTKLGLIDNRRFRLPILSQALNE
jgi:hypothetical protein